MNKMPEIAKEHYLNGNSCSVAVVKSAVDTGFIKPQDAEALVKTASAFSGGMGAGCLCGSISGAQIVLGYTLGRSAASRRLISEFTDIHGATCCRILSGKYKNDLEKRRENCSNQVYNSASILDSILKESFEAASLD